MKANLLPSRDYLRGLPASLQGFKPMPYPRLNLGAYEKRDPGQRKDRPVGRPLT